MMKPSRFLTELTEDVTEPLEIEEGLPSLIVGEKAPAIVEGAAGKPAARTAGKPATRTAGKLQAGMGVGKMPARSRGRYGAIRKRTADNPE